MIFFNEKKLRKIWIIFDIKNWLWKSEIGIFRSIDLERMLIWQKKIHEKVLFSLNWCGSWWKILKCYLVNNRAYALELTILGSVELGCLCLAMCKKPNVSVLSFFEWGKVFKFLTCQNLWRVIIWQYGKFPFWRIAEIHKMYMNFNPMAKKVKIIGER